MNRRQAAAQLLLYRRQNHCMYWVHPINQSCQHFGKFNPLYKDLRKYPDRFPTSYRMSTEQFDYILAQIEHLTYKPNTNWQHSISAEEKLVICIRYLYLLSFKSIKHKWKSIADEFYERWNFPNCIGAIDGKHVEPPLFY